jgi:enolase-phosphatase E1
MMIRAILLDIEGTTTPIDFVHKTLFPYAKQRIGYYVASHFGKLREDIVQLSDEHAHDTGYTLPLDPTEPGSVSAYLESLIERDRKSTPLKSIQGLIWSEGYESGDLVSTVYDDVPPAFRRWKAANKTIAIYSSGSVLAQQLIFKFSNHGDLTGSIDNYFDTHVGHKRESSSYRTIAGELRFDASEILFLSDVENELDAASEAGMGVVLVVRDGPEQVETRYRFVRSLDELSEES